MNDYTPMRGDILTRNGEKILIHLVTKTRVVFKLRYLGEDKGTLPSSLMPPPSST